MFSIGFYSMVGIIITILLGTNVTDAFIIGRVPNAPMPLECRIMNHEKIMDDDTVPRELVVNGVPYQVYGQIQHGATSRVFHAVDRLTSNGVGCRAVKVVDMHKIEQDKQNQLFNEAKMLSELNAKGLDRIPILYTMEHTPQNSMMVFELAHHDLFDEITPKMGQGEHQWVRRTFRDILRAIKPVHDNDIVHGDLKPENMAYFKTTSPSADPSNGLVLKVIDFGGAMKTDKLENACAEIVTGTILYMSPEQVAWCATHDNSELAEKRKAHKLSQKSDVWSVGIILYQMLFGENPYAQLVRQFEDVEDSEERVQRLDSALRPNILYETEPIEYGEYEDTAILEMLKKCLERHPERRPTIAELLTKLDQLDHQQAFANGDENGEEKLQMEYLDGEGTIQMEKMARKMKIGGGGGGAGMNFKDIIVIE